MHAALSVVELLVVRSSLGVSELARELGLAKSTLHRVCAVLVERGWVVRDGATGRYALGVRAIGIGARTTVLPLVTAFQAAAAALRSRHDETICLVVLDSDEAVLVAMEESGQPIRMVSVVGSRAPAYATAAGRVLLAARPLEQVAESYRGLSLIMPSGRRLDGVDALAQLLALARADGFTETQDEAAEGLWEVAVPVRNDAGDVLAALAVAAPISRRSPARRAQLVDDLVDHGRRLSDDAGWLPHWSATRVEPRPAPAVTARSGERARR